MRLVNKDKLIPDIELTHKEWYDFCCNTVIQGMRIKPITPDDKVIEFGGFRWYLDESEK
jgi:hypothetical protein